MQSDDQYIMEENGKRYRMLQVGETLENKDQFFNKSGKSWHDLGRSFVKKHKAFKINPADYGFLPQGYYRRPITMNKAGDA